MEILGLVTAGNAGNKSCYHSVLLLSVILELLLRYRLVTEGAQTEEALAVSFMHGKVQLGHLFIAVGYERKYSFLNQHLVTI